MSEKPILFNTEMVLSILEGHKMQTRRVMKPQPVYHESLQCGFMARPSSAWVWSPRNSIDWYAWQSNDYEFDPLISYDSPYDSCENNNFLWVRETHHIDWYPNGVFDCHGHPGTVHYKANDDIISQSWVGRWRPSIHMPRWASRITLRVIDVRVERLQDISEEDALAEGIQRFDYGPDYGGKIAYGRQQLALGVMEDTAKRAFMRLWDGLNAERGFSWDTNPWVWVVEFERMTP